MTLPELQAQIDRACEILKIALGAQRERMVRRLTALLKVKRQMLGDRV
jgi:hypothetical protein